MKLELKNRWVRVLVELLPAAVPIRRYRVTPRSGEALIQRALRLRITRRVRQWEHEAA